MVEFLSVCHCQLNLNHDRHHTIKRNNRNNNLNNTTALATPTTTTAIDGKHPTGFFFYFFFLLIFCFSYDNYFSHLDDHNSNSNSINGNRSSSSSSSAAGCRWYGFFSPFFPYLMFILGSLNTSKRRWQQQQHGLEMRHVSSRWYILYLCIYYDTHIYLG